MKNNYRHGDVVIIKSIMPKNAIDKKHGTLAEGEVTGHFHKIVNGDASVFQFNNEMYLRVKSDIAKIDHPEHGLKDIAKGDYKIKIHKTWQEDGWTKVID